MSTWDITKAKITKDGIADFFWPLPFGRMQAFNNLSINLYADLIKELEGQYTAEELAPYKVLAKMYLIEIAGLYRALLLKKFSNEAGKEYDIPDYWDLTPYIWNDRQFPANRALESLVRGPATPKNQQYNLKRYLNLIKNLNPLEGGMNLDGLKIKPVHSHALSNSIIVTQRNELIKKHALVETKEKIFCRSQRWFSPITQKELVPENSAQHKTIQNKILNIFTDICRDNQTEIPDSVIEHLKSFIKNFSHCYAVHYKRLLQKEILPSHLWIGSSGNIWDLLLSMAVRQRGGHVQAHDHGTASGLTTTYAIPILEFWAPDQFITYTPEHAALLKKLAKKAPTLSSQTTDIIGMENTLSKAQHSKAVTDTKISKIMIVSTIYDRDRGRIGELPSEYAKVDFQARLIGYLTLKGYEVILKAHPESLKSPPSGLEDLGAVVEERSFGETYQEADLLLFTYAYTSTFKEGIMTNKPMVMLDVENIEWEKTMLPLLEKRITLVRGGQDDSNRFVVNWNNLSEAIETAPLKAANTEFQKKYFGAP